MTFEELKEKVAACERRGEQEMVLVVPGYRAGHRVRVFIERAEREAAG